MFSSAELQSEQEPESAVLYLAIVSWSMYVPVSSFALIPAACMSFGVYPQKPHTGWTLIVPVQGINEAVCRNLRVVLLLAMDRRSLYQEFLTHLRASDFQFLDGISS